MLAIMELGLTNPTTIWPAWGKGNTALTKEMGTINKGTQD